MVILLTLLIVMSFGLLCLCFVPEHQQHLIRSYALALSFLPLFVTSYIWYQFDASAHVLQMLVLVGNSHLCFGVDAVGVSLLILTASLFPICMMLLRTVSGYVTFLLLEILLLGALCILDLLGFYVLFEATLLLLFLLIGRYPYGSMDAAYKIVIYTMAGSLVLLPMILAMYSLSGTTNLLGLVCHLASDAEEQNAVVQRVSSSLEQNRGSPSAGGAGFYGGVPEIDSNGASSAVRTEARGFLSQTTAAFLKTDVVSVGLSGPKQMVLGWGLLIVFAVKIPLIPVHLWLPEAHVSAPTAGSVLLAGVLLKLGGLGIIRFMLPCVPAFCVSVFPLASCLCLISFLFSTLSTLRQVDLKKIVAYSSIAHMSLVTLAILSSSEMSAFGATFMMVAHGIVSPALFLLVGLLYDRTHTKLLHYFSGVGSQMPVMAVLFLIFTLANLSFPLFANFVAEMLCLVSLFAVHELLAYVFCVCQVLGAAYGFWAFNRVVHGIHHTSALTFEKANVGTSINAVTPVRRKRKTASRTPGLTDLSRMEFNLLLPLLVGVLWLGMKPMP